MGASPPKRASIGSSKNVIWLLTATVLGLALACAVASKVIPWIGWAYFGLVFYILYTLIMLKFSPQTFLLISPFAALHLTELLSGISIEHGAYMVEISAVGRATGAFMRLSAIYIAFFAVCVLVVEYFWPRVRHRFVDAAVQWQRWSGQMLVVLIIIVGGCSAYMLFYGLQVGFPLITHTDRFAFLHRATSIYKAILLNRIVIAPLIGCLFVIPRHRLMSVGMLLGIVFISVLFAEKFTSLLTILCLYIMPIGLVHIANGGIIKLRDVAILGVVISIGTMVAVLNIYGASENMDNATQQLANRANAQGELWFMADDLYLDKFQPDVATLRADVGTWLKSDSQTGEKVGVEFGQYYVMDKFAKEDLVRQRIKDGTGYVFAFYAYMLIAMGLWGLLGMSTLIAALFAGTMLAFAWSVSKGRWLEALLYGRLMSSFYSMTTTGFFWNQFGIKSIVTLVAVIALGIATDMLFKSKTTGLQRPQVKVRVREN
jgi:hypothetical protein